ncbi:oxygenase MpaB family protein [Homoserinimonas sp. A520]
MAGFSNRWRSNVLSTLTGDDDGLPPWVDKIEHGDDAGYFGPGSAAWAVHGGLPTMVAGIRSLLLQALHPGAMAGVHDWSRYQEDALGRLSGTVKWLVTVTYADTELARAETARVERFHDRVRGTYVDNAGNERSYAASDPALLRWVHLVFADSFLACHQLWGGPIPGGADQYVREWATAGDLLGVPNPPRSEAELRDGLDAYSGELRYDERVAEVVGFIRNPPLTRTMKPAYRIMFAGAVASLPRRYRAMLGLRRTWLPSVTATRVMLGALQLVLGGISTSEEAARRRIERLETADAR